MTYNQYFNLRVIRYNQILFGFYAWLLASFNKKIARQNFAAGTDSDDKANTENKGIEEGLPKEDSSTDLNHPTSKDTSND